MSDTLEACSIDFELLKDAVGSKRSDLVEQVIESDRR